MSECMQEGKTDGMTTKGPYGGVGKQVKAKHNAKRRKPKKMVNILQNTMDDCGSVGGGSSSINGRDRQTVKLSKVPPANLKAGTSQNFNPQSTVTDTSQISQIVNFLRKYQTDKTMPMSNSACLELIKQLGIQSTSTVKKRKPVKAKKVTSKLDQAKVTRAKPQMEDQSNFNRKSINLEKAVSKQKLSEFGKVDLNNPSLLLLMPELQESLSSNFAAPKEVISRCLRVYSAIDYLNKTGNQTTKNSIKQSQAPAPGQEPGPGPKQKLQEDLSKFKKNAKKKLSVRNSNKIILESATSNGSERIFVNSELHQTAQEDTRDTVMSAQSGKNKKDQNENTKFPKYLTEDELKSLSNFGVLMNGVIRINQKNYKEAYITVPDTEMDILIEGLRDRNRALEGDDVYFILKPKEHHRTSANSTDVQRTAAVVSIKTLKHNRSAIGTLKPLTGKNLNYAMFSPRDMRLPRIRIKKNHWPQGFAEDSEKFKDTLLLARITQWNNLKFADGEIATVIGQVGDVEAETKAILSSCNLETAPYSDELKKYLVPVEEDVLQAEIRSREDFRRDCVFTIDPATAVDLDDAVSWKSLPNGNFEAGVHISDVSYYLKEGTPLDEAISNRATTIYLVQRAYHMLPLELCTQCSLTPGEDKLSFSVLWEVTPDCQIVGHRFARTVINSCAKFSYGQVQSIIDGSTDVVYPKLYGSHTVQDIETIVRHLHRMAVHLRRKRFENGALKIDQKKILFTLDENQLPKDLRAEDHEESHELIEEFMLLANVTVAERLCQSFPDIAFLRSHSPPVNYILKKLQKKLENYDMTLDISSAKSINAFLLNYSGDDVESSAQMLVLSNLLAKPMVRANYFCSGVYPEETCRRHYALNVPVYTHFTSPIRRYADIMVHRLLATFVANSSAPRWTADYVQSIANQCNKQKYAAKQAGEMSTELFHSIYIGLAGAVTCDAVVCDIKDKSFDCIVLSTGTHQRVYFEGIKAEVQQVEEKGMARLTVTWPPDEDHTEKTVETIQMFGIVKVQLKRSKSLKIETSLMRRA